jgi:hypothetical protein
VAGAFDKVWWKALLANLKHCGMGGRSHKLITSYLSARFLKVVAMNIASKVLEYFCGVPQGAIWSPKFWNFHMRELPRTLKYTEDVNYADDTALIKLFGTMTTRWTEGHFSRQTAVRHQALCEINQDLEALHQFGIKWKVTFEPTKTHAMLVSNTRDCCFPSMSQLIFGGKHISFEEELTLVGFVFDKRLTWKPMVDKVASKARRALGAIRRIKKLLGPSALAVLYKAFVRSILEYGLLEYIAAAPSHLCKLDRIQSSAQRLCGSKFTPLSDRRDAAAFGLICKLLGGECVQQLQDMCPTVIVEKGDRSAIAGRTRSNESFVKGHSGYPRLKISNRARPRLDSYHRSFGGQMDSIVNKVPSDILKQGLKDGWSSAMKPGQRFLGGSQHSKEFALKKGVYLVEKVIGTEISANGRRYLVKWQEYPGEDSWESERNLIGAESAVSAFWVQIGEQQPMRQNSTNEAIARRYEAQINRDLMFRG